MREFNITTKVQETSLSELSPALQKLVAAARAATYRSYAPYSHFNVGAAILLDDDTIVSGSNQENVAYPSGTCAERTACFYAHASHPDRKFRAIAIAARGTDGEWVSNPISPCGSCRQALLEYETLSGYHIEVLLCAKERILIVSSINDLLPLAFTDF